MGDRRGEYGYFDPLAALGVCLSARRLVVDYGERGLRVENPEVRGCCAEVAHASDLITCRRRPDDGGREWLFTSWQHPIAEADADHLEDAALYVQAYLSRRPEDVGAER